MSTATRPDYGLDAPGVVRNLLLVGAAGWLLFASAASGLWSGTVAHVNLAGNRPEATLETARREGVADRVEVRTADMRELPFADGSFDVAVSNVAIHNIYDAADRAKAVAEVARVLKPGGRALVNDIRHIP